MSRLCGAAEEAADADGLKGALLKLLLATWVGGAFEGESPTVVIF